MSIHPTAIVHSRAEVSEDAEIGPFCVIDANVRIAAGCRLYQNVYVTGHTTLGENCVAHPFTVIGNEPQDLKYGGAVTCCRIGARTVLREGVTIHRGTEPESETIIGEDCYFMATSHVGHNCRLGDHVILANGTMLGGHVHVDQRCTFGGACVVHQFCRIGELAMIQGHGGIGRDIVPFAMVDRMGLVSGLNQIGLRRSGMPREDIMELRQAFRLLFGKRGAFSQAVEELAGWEASGPVKRLLAFLQADSKRGFAGRSRD